jgi:hypothetical protein
MDERDCSGLAAFAARLDELTQVCARLSRENAELRDQVSRLTPGTAASSSPGAGEGEDRRGRTGTSDGKLSRRMIGKALGAAAAGVVGAVALSDAVAGPAAASDGSSIIMGDTNTAESATTVGFNGALNPGVAFLVNDTIDSAASDSAYPAALGGWAGTKCSTGVYGFTEINGGNGVVGVAGGTSTGNGLHGLAFQPGQIGVFGENSAGTAIAGTSASTAADATAIVGTINTTTPGLLSAGVRGVNNGTDSAGFGVYGSHAGHGCGVYGFTAGSFGNGVLGNGWVGVNGQGSTTGVTGTGNDVGVSGNGPIGVIADGNNTGLSASGVTAVHAKGKTIGVAAIGPTAVHGNGSGNGSRGGVFSGTAAQVQLSPGTLPTHPKSGTRGDLYADSKGRLWFCKAGGNTAVWHQIA